MSAGFTLDSPSVEIVRNAQEFFGLTFLENGGTNRIEIWSHVSVFSLSPRSSAFYGSG